MTERSKKTDLFSEAVFARLDGVEAPDRRRWLDRDARRGLWAVGGIFAAVVMAAGLSQIMMGSTVTSQIRASLHVFLSLVNENAVAMKPYSPFIKATMDHLDG